MNAVRWVFFVFLLFPSCRSYHQFCSNNVSEDYQPKPLDFDFTLNTYYLKDSTRLFLEIFLPAKNFKTNFSDDSLRFLKIYVTIKNNYEGKKTLYTDTFKIDNPSFQIRNSEHKPEAFLKTFISLPRFLNSSSVIEAYIAETIGKKNSSKNTTKNDRIINEITKYLYLPSSDLNSRNYFIITNTKGEFLFRDYFYVDDTLLIKPSYFSDETKNEMEVHFFTNKFSASLPPMASLDRLRIKEDDKVGESGGLIADESHSIYFNQKLNFNKKGLYLFVQKEKNGKEHKFSFRVHDNDYPLITEIKQMSEPLIYLTTKEEYIVFKDTLESKVAMDKFWLKIAREKNHARDMIREYYKRVEFCNQYFSTYKEGWKTDRGMIYIVFGAPQEVYRYNDYEVWEYYYDMNQQSVLFKFNRIESPFSLQHYVLDRSFQLLEPWYSAIDEWRNGILKIIKNKK